MKTIKLFLLFSIVAQILAAQTKTIPPGKYISDKDRVTIELNKDQTYELIFMTGNYTTENDTIYFKNGTEGTDSFTLKETAQKSDSDSITIHFKSSYSYYMDKLYLGTAKDEQGQVQYSSLQSMLKPSAYEDIEAEEYTFTIPKTTTLYLVESGYKRKIPLMSTYSLAATTTAVEITYQPSKFNDLNLRGYTDEVTGKFVVTDGRKPLEFTKYDKTNTKQEEQGLQPDSVVKNKHWKAPDIEEEQYTYESTENATEVEEQQVQQQYTPSESLKKALQKIETTGQYVVMAYNPDVEAGKKEFTAYTNQYATQDTIFHYYLAKSKDKVFFETNGIADQSGIVILNAAQTILYYAPGNLEANYNNFVGYYGVKRNIETADRLAQFDALLEQKKVSTSDLKKAFGLLVEVKDQYEFKKNFKEAKGKKASPKQEYYYTLKSSKADVNAAWEKLLEAYLVKGELDQELITLTKEALDRRGFNDVMFDSSTDLCSAEDMKAVQYVLKVYEDLAVPAKTGCCYRSGTSNHNHVTKKEMDNVLISMFSRNMDTYNEPSAEHINAIQPLFKEYVTVSGYDYRVVNAYLGALKRNYEANKEAYYTTYQNFYTKYYTENTNVFESLNAIYTSSSSANSSSWDTVKYTIASTANTVAWAIVEESDAATKSKWMEQAIQWSKMSLAITPDSPYYLDTLAQLYYQNGAKEKAISIQEKASIAGAKQLEPESKVLLEIKNVLQAMKNNTYGTNGK